MQRGRSIGQVSVALALLLFSGCALLRSTPEDAPPEAPSARVLFRATPAERARMLPVPPRFDLRDYLDRLSCLDGEVPTWRRTSIERTVATFEVECPGEPPHTLVLDASKDAPEPPTGLRQMPEAALVHLRDEQQKYVAKDLDGALAAVDAGLQAAPGEVVLRRERVALLFAMDRIPEAFFEAEMLAKEHPSPIVYRFRALAAQRMGLQDEVRHSVRQMRETAREGHPLYAEAVCVEAQYASAAGEPEAEAQVELGCRLGQAPCCELLEQRQALIERMRRSLEAAEQLGVPLPTPEPQTSVE